VIRARAARAGAALAGVRRTAVVALVSVAALVGAGCGGGDDGESGSLPDLTLPAVDGGSEIDLTALDGPAVVNLWATWCAPCRRELPDFEQVHQARGDEVAFVGVNIGDTADAAGSFLDEVGVTFPNYLDERNDLTAELGTATLPVTLVLDADGRIVTEHIGPMTAAELTDAIDDALAAPDPGS
jgi:cytochrome c biogenesis protein CcmG, thiol:disulfide interchange protein DsbE